MSESEMDNTVTIDGYDLEIWPEDVQIKTWLEPTIKVVRFPDTDTYHSQLKDTVFGLERDPALGVYKDNGIFGSSKVFYLDRWGCPAADLIHARAREFYRKVLSTENAVVDISWATVYREGESCSPHSHNRSTASIVYFLDLGTEEDRENKSGGFRFADPRMDVCCREEPDCMTTPSGPKSEAGMMVIFPSHLVHFVHTYRGKVPRITLAWNINEIKIPGKMAEDPE